MGQPSKIDRLPDDVRELIGRLRRRGRTIEEIRAKLAELDVDVSRSGLGRHIKKIDAIAERVRETRAAAEAIMAKLGEKESRVTRLNIELMHASLMKSLADAESLDPKEAMLLGRAIRDLATAARQDADRELRLRRALAKRAAGKIDQLAAGAGISKKTRDKWRREVLGLGND